MLQYLLKFFKRVVYIIIGVCEYIYTWLSHLNPGTQWGIGVAGCIGVIGFLLRFWVWTTGIVVCLMGGFIASGMSILTKNPRSTDKMLQYILEFLKGVAYIIIGVCEYIYTRLSLLNPGTQWGIGVAGCIGVIGFLLRFWVWTTGIVVCLLGGFIGSAMYKSGERSWADMESRASEERMFSVLSGSGILRGNERENKSPVTTYR